MSEQEQAVQPEPTQQPTPEGNTPEGQASQPDQPSSQPKQEDLLTRVTKFVETESPTNKSDTQIDTDIYNDTEFRAKIDGLQDPELKEYMIQLRKSGIRGVNEKLGEIAEIRKEIQSIKGSQQPEKWSAQRVQNLINDPDFLAAAQQVTGVTPSNEDDEYVPESVKRKLAELDQVKSQMSAWQLQQFKQNIDNQHTQLSTKYGNYDRNKVDEIRKELLEGNIQATNEHLYKAWTHDENVKNAYEMGRRDAQEGITEKERSSSPSGYSQTQNSTMKAETKETDKQFWRRIVEKNAALMKSKP